MRSPRNLFGWVLAGVAGLGVAIAGQSATTPGNPWPPARKATETSPALSAADEMKTFSLPPGFHAELVADEPLVESPILIDFDPDGRLWVLELTGFLADPTGRDSREPINRVVVLEDTDGDGKMDKRTVFADGLVMPRALKVLDHGVLVGEPPNLWLMKDTDGDLKADTKERISTAYGNANAGIEHNANSLFWAMDNVIYTSEHDWNLQLEDGKFETVPSLSRGQWQISQDDAGRIYRNVNDSPLYVDYTPARYFLRNPNGVRTRGLYESLIEQLDATVYPVRPTRGVNRGYRDPFFRADGSSIVIQGAGTPTIYRGDKYPKDLQGNAFITDSPTNLVHRLVVTDDGTGRLTAKNGYARGEFLASSDERFRPVSLFSAPDGAMYVVDMYRGVVQAGGLWSDYLTEYIKSRNLLQPNGRGRIWRVVYGTGPNRLGPKPSLSAKTPAQLAQTLSNPNGWWRDTAQRLLVERGDRSVAPALTALAVSAPDWRTRLHALWTLDGLDSIEETTVTKALTDISADVRATAIRISERWLKQPNSTMAASVLKLGSDKSWTVRRQLAASIGEMPAPARVEPILSLFARDGGDPIIVDAAVSGLKGLEADALDRVLQANNVMATSSEAVTMLSAAVAKSGDSSAVQRILDDVAETSRSAWQKSALLQGLDAGLPVLGGRNGRGGGGGLPGLSGGARAVLAPGRGVTLPAEPAALTRLAAGSGEIATLAKNVTAKLDWPGRPAPVITVAPLTAEQQKRFDAGAEIYKNICLGCHQSDGRGKDKVGANLVDSRFVTATDTTAVVRILLSGKEGAIGLMPPLGSALNDEQIASALTYVRREWGHTGSAVNPLDVMEVRGLTKARTRPWTDAELTQGRGGRGAPASPPAAGAGRGQ